MKKLFLFILIIISLNAFSQKTKSLDSISEYTPVMYTGILPGIIEIEGHQFSNSKSKDQIKFISTLEGIKIYDSKKEYNYEKCKIHNCKIIHLKEKFKTGYYNFPGVIFTNTTSTPTNGSK